MWGAYMGRVYICVGRLHGWGVYLCGAPTWVEFISVWGAYMGGVYICVGRLHG